MIALDLNVAAFYRTAGATELLQAPGELLQFRTAEWQAGDHRHGLTTATGNFTANAHARTLGRLCRGGLARRGLPQYDATELAQGFHA